MTIRNDQYLHRLTAGRGAIKPDDPLEVRLYGPDGKPIGVQDDALKVALTGRTVSIGGQTYEFDPPRTLYGLAASRPSAAAAHAVVPFALYVSADTKTIEMTDGTTWRRWGVF